MTVYIDVLLLSNLWLDHAMLRAAARLTHSPLPPARGLLAAGIGACSALCILLPPMPPPVCVLLRIGCALLMSLTAFRRDRLLLHTLLLFAVSVFFCGAVYLAAQLLSGGCLVQNAFVYTDISLMTLLLGSAAAAWLSRVWYRHKTREPKALSLELRIDAAVFRLPAFADTGSSLRDVFTGQPVIVCPAAALETWLGQYADTVCAAQSRRGFRMLPVSTVTGMRLLPAFKPDAAALSLEGARPIPVDVLIALTDTPAERAVVPDYMLSGIHMR